jgi:hypothetical protein
MMKSDRNREQKLRAQFASARKSYPKWHHTSLISRVWPKRPRGTNVHEVLRIAKEFALPDKATTPVGEAEVAGGGGHLEKPRS